MFDSGIYAYRDDPVSKVCVGLVNRMLRSRWATAGMFIFSSTVTGIGVWNGLVDIYVAKHGVTESARVMNLSGYQQDSGYQVDFAYRYGDRPDTLRVFEPWWQNREPGVGSCRMTRNPSSCRDPTPSVHVTYLTDSPGVYIVEGAESTRMVMWILTTIPFLVAVGCLANWILLTLRIGPLSLPSWSDIGMDSTDQIG